MVARKYKRYNCGLYVQDETMIFPWENALEIIEDVTTKIPVVTISRQDIP
jgi:hypothetical protein